MDRFTTTEVLQAQSHLWNLVLSHLKSMSLKAAIDLGIADILHKHGKPMTLAQLTTSLSIPTSKSDHFRRLMRALVHQRIFSSTDQETQSSYSLTPTSYLLLSENSSTTSWNTYLRLTLDPTISHPSFVLGSWFKSPEETPFHHFHGKRILEMIKQDPEFNRLLSDRMASDSVVVMDVVLRSCAHVFQGVDSLVDVGGGTGITAMAIKKAFPEMKCTVLDLPEVVAGMTDAGGVHFIDGDMFRWVPPATALMLKCILHDWDDEECIEILKHCKEAIPTKKDGGKIIIIEMVVDLVMDNHVNGLETQLLFDLELLTLTTGKERNESEWRNLFFAAGFTEYKISPSIGLRSIIELYP